MSGGWDASISSLATPSPTSGQHVTQTFGHILSSSTNTPYTPTTSHHRHGTGTAPRPIRSTKTICSSQTACSLKSFLYSHALTDASEAVETFFCPTMPTNVKGSDQTSRYSRVNVERRESINFVVRQILFLPETAIINNQKRPFCTSVL